MKANAQAARCTDEDVIEVRVNIDVEKVRRIRRA